MFRKLVVQKEDRFLRFPFFRSFFPPLFFLNGIIYEHILYINKLWRSLAMHWCKTQYIWIIMVAKSIFFSENRDHQLKKKSVFFSPNKIQNLLGKCQELNYFLILPFSIRQYVFKTKFWRRKQIFKIFEEKPRVNVTFILHSR